MSDLVGYDGNGYDVGDRVELHPGTDLWMSGARFGVVIARSQSELDRVRVELDKQPGRIFFGTEDTFRRVV